MNVVLYNHTHWDIEWYQTFEEFRIRFADFIELLFKELDSENIESFYLDGQTVIIEDLLDLYPEKKYELINKINNKKILTGPWYTLADEFLVSGECLIRNLLIGMQQSKKLGCDEFIGYLPDSFGHNSQMPAIFNMFGIKNIVLWRGAGNLQSQFIWKSSDSSEANVLYLTEGYFQDILHRNIDITAKAELLRDIIKKINDNSLSKNILLPVGADHLGPVLNLKQLINELNSCLPEFSLKEGTIQSYFNEIKFTKKMEIVTEELRSNERSAILPGVFSTRIYLKQNNAESSWNLIKLAEPLQAYLQWSTDIKNRKNELLYAWKLLLKNQAHDGICGCSIDAVHKENLIRYEKVNQISENLINRSLNHISKSIENDKIFLVNLSNYNYTGVVIVQTCKPLGKNISSQFIKKVEKFPNDIILDTQQVPVCEHIKEYYEYLVKVKDIAANSVKVLSDGDYCNINRDLFIDNNKIRNTKVEVTVNKDGSLNLTNLLSDKTFENIHVITDRGDEGDSYNYSPIKDNIPVKAEFIGTEIIERGPLRCKLRVLYKLTTLKDYLCADKGFVITNLKTDITITADSDRVDFNTVWENFSKNHTLKIKFNTGRIINKTISENTHGIIERNFDNTYRIEENMPANNRNELKTNTAPMQRFVLANGLGIITRGLHEYGVSDNEIFITVLRATGKLSKVNLGSRNFPAGPPLDTTESECIGKQSVSYSLFETDDPNKLFKEADEFMGVVLCGLGTGTNVNNDDKFTNFLNINNESLYLYSVKVPENKNINGILARVMNLSESTQSTKITSGLTINRIVEVNGLEEPSDVKYSSNDSIKFNPYELKSLLLLR